MPGNPCMDCRCGDDGQPIDCAEMICDIIECSAGQYAKPIPGTCCGQECVDLPGRGLFNLLFKRLSTSQKIRVINGNRNAYSGSVLNKRTT